jgi:hypothetical protein
MAPCRPGPGGPAARCPRSSRPAGVTRSGVTRNGVTRSGVTRNGVTRNDMTRSGVTRNGVTRNSVTRNRSRARARDVGRDPISSNTRPGNTRYRALLRYRVLLDIVSDDNLTRNQVNSQDMQISYDSLVRRTRYRVLIRFWQECRWHDVRYMMMRRTRIGKYRPASGGLGVRQLR